MKIKPEYQQLSICEIEIPVSIQNMLYNMGIRTLGDLEKHDLSQFRVSEKRHFQQFYEFIEPLREE